MNRMSYRSLIVLVLVAVLLVGMVLFFFSYLANANEWVIASGSKHVYQDRQLQVGMMLDRTGALLVDNSGNRVYGTDALLRRSMLHWIGDREGNVVSSVLNHYSDELVDYNTVDGVYRYGETDSRMRLTLSAQIQSAALTAMGDHSGTVAVMNYKTGELLCALSTPGFDPEDPPDIGDDVSSEYEGVYVNRFVRSVYTPGSVFKLVTLAAALETVPEIKHETFICVGTYDTGDGRITCELTHGEQDLKTAFANSCNCAFAQIALRLGRETLKQYVAKLGVTDAISFDGIVAPKGNYDITAATDADFAWSAIGQQKDLINPCAYLTFVSAIANGGQGPRPYVVSTVSKAGKTNYTADTQMRERILSEKTAQTLHEYMGNNVLTNYGSQSFGSFAVCAKTGTAEVGGDKKPNAMLVGFVTDEDHPYAFIVAVEDGGYGKDICIPIIAEVLAACAEADFG